MTRLAWILTVVVTAATGCRATRYSSSHAVVAGSTLRGKVFAADGLGCPDVWRFLGEPDLDKRRLPKTCPLALAFSLDGDESRVVASTTGDVEIRGRFRAAGQPPNQHVLEMPRAGSNRDRIETMTVDPRNGQLITSAGNLHPAGTPDGIAALKALAAPGRSPDLASVGPGRGGVAGRTFANGDETCAFTVAQATCKRTFGLAFKGTYAFDVKARIVTLRLSRHQERRYKLEAAGGRDRLVRESPPATTTVAAVGWTELCGEVVDLSDGEGPGGLWLFTDSGNFRLGFKEAPTLEAAVQKRASSTACLRFAGSVDRQKTGRLVQVRALQ